MKTLRLLATGMVLALVVGCGSDSAAPTADATVGPAARAYSEITTWIQQLHTGRLALIGPGTPGAATPSAISSGTAILTPTSGGPSSSATPFDR